MGITRQQALDCFASDDLIGIGMEADAVRRRLHPEGVVSYAIERTISYGDREVSGSSANLQSIREQIDEAVEMGGTGVHLRGVASVDFGITWLEALLMDVKQRFPGLWVHGLSASEILALAQSSGTSVRETIVRLQHAGLDSLAGDDAAILDDGMRQTSAERNGNTEHWLGVHRTAHSVGMPSTATMLFGMGETMERRIEHFEQIRRLQEQTGGFTAFISSIFQPGSQARASGSDEPTAVEYLKTLAISRMYLDNIANVQSSWLALGPKVLQMGLRFGGNDAGSVMLGANDVKAAGASNAVTEEELRRIIRDAGFKPVQRDTLYRTMFLN